MITEDYVSFEVAKLLKEKEFNENITTYRDDFIQHGNIVIPLQECLSKDKIKTPTLQMAMKWLREVRKININILYDAQRFVKTDGTTEDVDVYEVDIITKNGSIYIGNYNHYESACEAAIKYCLTNLI